MNTLQTDLLTPEEAATQAIADTALNGLRYATLGKLEGPNTSPSEICRLVGAVPAGMAAGVSRYAYLFVPLALSQARLAGDESAPFSATDGTLIASTFHASLAERAICHRNAKVGDTEYVFLSTRLHTDRFALAFEFFINVAHNFAEAVGTPASFAELAWMQARANVRGETSLDAWGDRAEALGQPPPERNDSARPGTAPATGRIDERARSAYQAATFADTLAIYLLSLYLDFDYADLREREYPLLAAPALAERLKAVSRLFPPNDGYEFQILYRKR